jgi:methyl-accepting chemotaxis protein
MTAFAQVLNQVRPALARLLAWLGDEAVPAEEPLAALATRYAAIRARLGRQAVARRLGLQEADFVAFDGALREAQRRIERLAPSPSGIDLRNAVIAAMRLLSWLESVAQRSEGFAFDLVLPQATSDELGRRQVRALELILRSVISTRYESQEKLLGRLKDLLSEEVVRKWLAAADRGDVLSGTTFSELASLFVSREEFEGYEPIYRDSEFLTLLSEKRVTMRLFLDDIRRVRNLLAHSKRITPLTVALLSVYYEELVEPLQEAFDQGRSRVDPDRFLDASAEELAAYFGKLDEDLRGVRDDLAELRAELVGKIDSLAAQTAAVQATGERVETQTRGANRKLRLTLAGIAVLAVAAGLGLWLGLGTRETAERTEQTAEETRQAVEGMAQQLQSLADTSGLVADPQTPAELYHNARLLAQRGEIDRALELYKRLFAFDIPYADPVLDLAALLKAKYGEAGAAAALPSVLPTNADPRFVAFAQQATGGIDAIEAAKALLISAREPYPPALWLAADGLMRLPIERFSFTLRKLALSYMDEVEAGLADGSLAQLYLDQIRLDAIRQQLAAYKRQFPEDAKEAFDYPLEARWERFRWVDGEDKLSVTLMWNTGAGAMDRTEPAEFWVRFVGQPPPYDIRYNVFDVATAIELGRRSYPPDMEVPPVLVKMARELAESQNPMAGQFMLRQPDSTEQLVEVRFAEVGGFERHFCIAVPNDDGERDIEYRPLAGCEAP